MPFKDSQSKVITAMKLEGVWIHDVTDPAGTLAQFVYGNRGRSEDIAIDGIAVDTLGRALPIVEFGEGEESSIELSFQIPFDQDHDGMVQTLRDMIESRNTLVYRDQRKRLMHGILTDMEITDEAFGTTVSCTLVANNYLETLNAG